MLHHRKGRDDTDRNKDIESKQVIKSSQCISGGQSLLVDVQPDSDG